MRTHLELLAFLLLVPALTAQDVHVVDLNHGAGWEYDTIQSAVNAAQDGDVVLVRAGTYYDESLTIDGKGITVTADAGATVILTEGVTIQLVPAGQCVVLRHLKILPDTWIFNDDKYGVRALFNAGSVRVEDCMLIASHFGKATFAPDSGAIVDDCASVVFSRCLVKGEVGSSGSLEAGMPALKSQSSQVSAFECEFVGGDAVSGAFVSGVGGDAAEIDGGSFYAAGCTFTPGLGSPPFNDGDCVDGLFAVLTLFDNVLNPAPNGQAISNPGGSLLQLAGQRRTLSMSSPVREGQPLTIDVAGEPGDLVALLVSLVPAHQLIVSLDQPLLVSLSPALILPIGRTGLDGSLSLAPTVVGLPAAFEGLTLFGQALFSASGDKSLSNATAVVLLDASL